MPAGTIRWANALVLDNGLERIRTATQMRLVSTFAVTNTHANVVTNTLAAVTDMIPGDYALTGANNAPRVLTVASGKTATATATNANPAGTHIVFTDGTTVLWATPELSGQGITINNVVNFPAGLTYTSAQPV